MWVECVTCVCVWLGAVLVERGCVDEINWGWALPILWGQGECLMCVCVLVAVVWVVW